MRSYMNRNWPNSALFHGGPIRIGFIVRWFIALALGFPVVHAEINESIDWAVPDVALEQRSESVVDFDRRANRIKRNMNENETIANLNPKLGKILARLIRAQEELPARESGEGDHLGKPPIGMKPHEIDAPAEIGGDVRTKSIQREVFLA